MRNPSVMVDDLAQTLGGFRDLPPAQRALGNVLFLLALFLTAFLERLQFQLRATEGSTWWASNGRDVANTVALASMTLALLQVGFEGPLALTVAASGVILLASTQSATAERPHAFSYVFGGSLLFGLPVLMAPREVDAFLRAVLVFLFDGTLPAT